MSIMAPAECAICKARQKTASPKEALHWEMQYTETWAVVQLTAIQQTSEESAQLGAQGRTGSHEEAEPSERPLS